MGKLFGESMLAYARMLKTCWPVLLIIFVPMEMLSVALAPEAETASEVLRSARIDNILYQVFGILGVAVAVRYIVAEHLQENKSCWRLLDEALSKWGVLFKTNLLGGFIIFGLLLCLVIPGIIWMGFYAFATYCVVIDELRPSAALVESKRLVRGAWWKVVGIFTLLILLALAASTSSSIGCGIVSAVIEACCEEAGTCPTWCAWFSKGANVVNGLVSDLLLQVVTVAGALLYYQRKREVDVVTADGEIE